MILIVDYGMGNLGSIRNMLRKIGVDAEISSDPAVVAKAEKLIVPGVGAFDNGMSSLKSMGLLEPLNERALQAKVPVLGICLGMQLFTKRSDEGELPGLGWIDAETIRFSFPDDSPLRVPHMGWNTIEPKPDEPIFQGLPEEPRFYFVHSYYVRCNDPADVIATATYGFEFSCAVRHGNICATQFHPEKSHKFGMAVLRAFAEVE